MSIFGKHDIDVILETVAEAVEWTFGDWDQDQGISSSDVSCVVRGIIRDLGEDPDTITMAEVKCIRNAVNNKMSEVLA